MHLIWCISFSYFLHYGVFHFVSSFFISFSHVSLSYLLIALMCTIS
uniref:Transducin family protein n=1 Tax=Rhizophora mucronata TaxID=61149 RepID=A0A2P2MDK6_RHIMU